MKKIIAALTLAILSQTALAAEWYLVEATKNTFFFVDKTSITRNGSKVKFWEWSVRNSPTGNPAWDNGKVLKVANCKEQTQHLLHFQFYNGESAVNGGSPPGDTTRPVIPDTAFETVFKTVCSGRFSGKPLSKLSVPEVQAAMADFYAEQSKH